MHSRHAITLALFVGAFAVVILLAAIFTLQYSAITNNPSAANTGTVTTKPSGKIVKPPRFETKIEGSDAVIAEIDKEGNTVNAIYTSSLTDKTQDFSIFAVPQEHYAGVIYVRALSDDTPEPLLKLYPLNVETGELGKAIISQPYDSFELAENQESVLILKGETSTSYGIVN